LLGFEHLTGRSADYSPASADIPLVVEAMTAFGRVACSDVELKDAGQRWALTSTTPPTPDCSSATKIHAWSHRTRPPPSTSSPPPKPAWQSTADDHPNAWTHRLSDAPPPNGPRTEEAPDQGCW
jgi:hypothetical protein